MKKVWITKMLRKSSLMSIITLRFNALIGVGWGGVREREGEGKGRKGRRGEEGE